MARCVRIFTARTEKRRVEVGRFRMRRVCVGVGDADLACRFESCFSAPLRARLRLTAETPRRRELVWRSVHCAPEPLALARPIGLNLDYPRPYGRGYELLARWCKNHTVNSRCGGHRTARTTRDQVLTKQTRQFRRFTRFSYRGVESLRCRVPLLLGKPTSC